MCTKSSRLLQRRRCPAGETFVTMMPRCQMSKGDWAASASVDWMIDQTISPGRPAFDCSSGYISTCPRRQSLPQAPTRAYSVRTRQPSGICQSASASSSRQATAHVTHRRPSCIATTPSTPCPTSPPRALLWTLGHSRRLLPSSNGQAHRSHVWYVPTAWNLIPGARCLG